MNSISDLILEENKHVFETMLSHPFVTQIEDGSLSHSSYHRYLVFEGRFVETAIEIFAFATAKAPDLPSKRHLIAVQNVLASEQMGYFENIYAELNVDVEIEIPLAVHAFDRRMREIARDGGFLDIVTAMFAAEWMYWTWCRKAASTKIANPHIREWIDMHVNETFVDQAHWLKTCIDKLATSNDLPRLTAVFAEVTALEIAFHTAPLERH